MKTAIDPRHQHRIKIIKELFAASFQSQMPNMVLSKNIQKYLSKIDQLIAEAAPLWPIPKIAKIDLAILRLAVYELNFEKKKPYKVIIDEAVEIAKEYGHENSPAFINGVLGSIMKTNQKTNNSPAS